MQEVASAAVVLVSVLGWGALVSRALRAASGLNLRLWSEQLALGIATVTALVGIAVAVDSASEGLLVFVVAAGVVFAAAVVVVMVIERVRAGDGLGVDLRLWLPGAL